jgi:hypothetical protein
MTVVILIGLQARPRRMATDRHGRLVQIDANCESWCRWVKQIAAGNEAWEEYADVRQRNLPSRIRELLDQACHAVERLQIAVNLELKKLQPERRDRPQPLPSRRT